MKPQDNPGYLAHCMNGWIRWPLREVFVIETLEANAAISKSLLQVTGHMLFFSLKAEIAVWPCSDCCIATAISCAGLKA